jgi:hypothetical protein
LSAGLFTTLDVYGSRCCITDSLSRSVNRESIESYKPIVKVIPIFTPEMPNHSSDNSIAYMYYVIIIFNSIAALLLALFNDGLNITLNNAGSVIK